MAIFPLISLRRNYGIQVHLQINYIIKKPDNYYFAFHRLILLIQHIVYNKIKEDTLRNIVLTTDNQYKNIGNFSRYQAGGRTNGANQDLVDYIRR